MTEEIENLREQGQCLFFEYRCWESPSSSDAELWYRSHQQVEVLRIVANDAYWPDGDVVGDKAIPREAERYEAGQLIHYRIRFSDGFEADAGEDELLDSEEEYCRPDPPRKPK